MVPLSLILAESKGYDSPIDVFTMWSGQLETLRAFSAACALSDMHARLFSAEYQLNDYCLKNLLKFLVSYNWPSEDNSSTITCSGIHLLLHLTFRKIRPSIALPKILIEEASRRVSLKLYDRRSRRIVCCLICLIVLGGFGTR
jgi:hypothetical protein